MSRANRLHELAWRLERFRDDVEYALTLAGQEVEAIDDELSSHVRGVRQHLARACDECEELEQRWASLRRLQGLWEAVRGDYDDRVRSLWRLIEEKVPLMDRWLQSAECEQDAKEAPAEALSERGAWGGTPSSPVAPLLSVVPRPAAPAGRIQDPAKEGDVWPPPPPSPRAPVSGPTLPGVHGATILAAPSRGRLPGALDDLRRSWEQVEARWRQSAGCWRSPAAQAFEGEHWRPLEQAVRTTLEQLEQVEETADRIRRELG